MKKCNSCGYPNKDNANLCFKCNHTYFTQIKPWYKQTWFIIVAVFAGLMIIGMLNPLPETKQSNSSQSQTQNESLSTAIVKNTIEDTLGSTNRGVDRVQDVFLDTSDNQVYLQVDIAADDNLSHSMIRDGIASDIKKVAKVLFTKFPQITTLQFAPTFSMKDKYGNCSEAIIGNIVYEQDTLKRIQWDNLYGDEVFDAADIHTLNASLYD